MFVWMFWLEINVFLNDIPPGQPYIPSMPIKSDHRAKIPVPVFFYGKPLNFFTIIQALPQQSWACSGVSIVRIFL
jgi:hypothetical protein